MTETLSHVAVKTLNGSGKTKFYCGLKNIEFSLNAMQCLQIKLPEHKQLINTNDLAQIYPNKQIEIIGRSDNVIITSGKKVNPEEIEKSLSHIIEGAYAITATPNEKYGNLITLVLEHESLVNEAVLNEWNENQESHNKVRKTLRLESLPWVQNGKLNRKVLLDLIKGM